jgi:hypothetical protein
VVVVAGDELGGDGADFDRATVTRRGDAGRQCDRRVEVVGLEHEISACAFAQVRPLPRPWSSDSERSARADERVHRRRALLAAGRRLSWRARAGRLGPPAATPARRSRDGDDDVVARCPVADGGPVLPEGRSLA